jgi:hypothetical protein
MTTKKELRERVAQLEMQYNYLCNQYESTRGKLKTKENEVIVMSGKLTADALMSNEVDYTMSIQHCFNPVLHPKLHVVFDLVYSGGKEPQWIVRDKNVSYSD